MNIYPEFLSGDFATRISSCRATYLSTKVGEVFLQTFVFDELVNCLPVSGSLVKIILELKYTSDGRCFQQGYSILYPAFSKVFTAEILMVGKVIISRCSSHLFGNVGSSIKHNFHCISFHSSAPWLRGQDYTDLANSLEEIYV